MRILRGVVLDMLVIFLLIVVPIRTLFFGVLGQSSPAVFGVVAAEFTGLLCYFILVRPAVFRRFPSLKRWFMDC